MRKLKWIGIWQLEAIYHLKFKSSDESVVAQISYASRGQGKEVQGA